MTLHLSFATESHPGRRRSRNEDAVAIDPGVGVIVVADGMGGHPAGGVASRMAVDEASRFLVGELRNQPHDGGGGTSSSTGERGERMARAVLLAHGRIRDAAATSPKWAGMGTTLTILRVDVTTLSFAVSHVGDSRAYRLRNGELRQITRDQTWVQEQVDAGRLSSEAARKHPRAALLTNALGLDDLGYPELYEGEVEDGDVFLVCTDGLTSMVPDNEIETLLSLRLPDGVKAVATALVEEANARGGMDNITVALAAIGSSRPSRSPTSQAG